MKKSELINLIIVKSGRAKTIDEANILFLQAFIEYYQEWSLTRWDTEVNPVYADAFFRTIGQGVGISVRYLIKDLDTFLKGPSHS